MCSELHCIDVKREDSLYDDDTASSGQSGLVGSVGLALGRDVGRDCIFKRIIYDSLGIFKIMCSH